MERSNQGIFLVPGIEYINLRYLIEASDEAVEYIRIVERDGVLSQSAFFSDNFIVRLIDNADVKFSEEFAGSQAMWKLIHKIDCSFENKTTIQMLRSERVGEWLVGNNSKPSCRAGEIYTSFVRPRLELMMKNILSDDTIAGTVLAYSEKFLQAYLICLFIDNPYAPIIRRMYSLFTIGYWPLAWIGPADRGYAIAWCPPHHPYQQVPEANRATPEYMAAAKVPVATRPPLPLAVVEVPVVPVESWAGLAELPPSLAFQQQFGFLAETAECVEILELIAARCERIVAGPKVLTVHFLPTPCEPGWEDEDEDGIEQRPTRITLKAKAPFVKKLGPLPPLVAALVRRHNGITILSSDGGTPPNVPVYNGKTFACPDWQNRYRPDQYDPEESFTAMPLVVFDHEFDLFVCHPHIHRNPGDPALVRLSHGTGQFREPLPYGLGALLLRSLGGAVLGYHIEQERGWTLPGEC